MSRNERPEGSLASRRELYALATGYRDSAIFLASLELDLYSHIPPEGVDAEQLAAGIGCEVHPLTLLLEALSGMGVLSRERGRYILPPDFAELLARDSGSFADYLLLQRAHYRSWSDLDQLVRGAPSTPAQEEGVLCSPELIGHYLDLIGANNRLTQQAVMSGLAPVLREASSVLDLGGGNGRFAELLTSHYPKLRVWVVDLEAAITFVRSKLESSDRIELVAGDARALALDFEIDVVTLNDMLHYFSRVEKQEIIERAVRALRPGGTIAVCNQRLDGDAMDRAASALFSFRMFADTQKGYVEAAEETRQLLEEAGAEDISETPVTGNKVLFVGRRPVWT